MHLPRPPPSKTQHDTLFSSLFESCISGGGGGGIVLFSSGSYLPSVCACAPQVCATDTYVTKERAAVERERKKEPPQIRVFFLPKKVGGPSFLGFFFLGPTNSRKRVWGSSKGERERDGVSFLFSAAAAAKLDKRLRERERRGRKREQRRVPK